MELRIWFLVSLLLWISLTSDGSVGAMPDDPDEGNSRISLEGLTPEESSLQVKPKITVEVPMGEDTELQCSSQTGQGKGAVFTVFSFDVKERTKNILLTNNLVKNLKGLFYIFAQPSA